MESPEVSHELATRFENMSDAPLAVFPGTYDPITFGHIDVLEKAMRLFPNVVVAVGNNPSKKPLFDLATRLSILSDSLSAYPCVEVTSYEGLLSRFCADLKVDRKSEVIVIRGIRTVSDIPQESVLAQTLKDLGRIHTVWIPSDMSKAHISSSLFRELASTTTSYQDLRTYVPPNVIDVLRDLRSSR